MYCAYCGPKWVACMYKMSQDFLVVSEKMFQNTPEVFPFYVFDCKRNL